MKKVFCFEVKTTSVFGDIYKIASVVYDLKGTEINSFVCNCKTDRYTDTITHMDYPDMLSGFSRFFLSNKNDADIVLHLNIPNKSYIFKDMFTNGLLDILDIPYPLIDISGNLKQAGYNPISVEPYNNKNGINLSYLDGDGINNPLYYSRAVALCYIDLIKKVSVPIF